MSALDFLPHGHPFRFVDEILALEEGKSARGRYHLRGDEEFLRGHFPGHPIMPGVLMLEAIAQLGGIVAQSDQKIAALEDLRLAGVRGAKIFGTAGPGEALDITAEVEGRLGKLVQVRGEVSAGGKVLARATLHLGGSA